MSEERITENYKEVTLVDGKIVKVRKLSLGSIKRMVPEIEKIDELRQNGKVSVELIDKMTDICYEILKVNNEVTKEYLL